MTDYSEKSTFLNDADLVRLTGRTYRKLQIEALRKMGVPFFVNALGRPIVPCAVIEGRASAPAPQNQWTPNVLKKKKKG